MTAATLRFREPSDEMLDGVRRILRALPVCNPPRFKKPYTRDRLTVRGDLNRVMAVLKEVLLQDFRENEQECAEWNGGFDYVVVPSDLLHDAVHIKTRLYSKDPEHRSQGDILYGRVVERVGADDFILWVDDDE
jgi:hypothetical protein